MPQDVLIADYDLEVTSPPCEPGSERWSAFAKLETDISAVLPYLNAVWPDALYEHRAKVLTRRSQGHAIAIRPHEVAVSNVRDRGDAQRLVEELIAEINTIWARRDEITPSTEKRQRPTAMELYKLLPRTNCKACGQPSCWAFALQLAAGSTQLDVCTPLNEPVHLSQREQLARLLGIA